MIPSQGSNTAAARRVTNRGIAYGKHSPRDDSADSLGRGPGGVGAGQVF